MLIVLLVFCHLTNALVFPGPIPTPVDNNIKLDPRAANPLPTAAPDFNEILKRQAGGNWTLLEGPNSVCGYEFGLSDEGLGLCGTSTCGFATKPGYDGSVYCFDATSTRSRFTWTSCIYGSSAVLSCLGDSACSDNPGIALCTASSYTHCNIGTFVGLGVGALWCDTTDIPGTVPISTTYAGQIGRAFTTVGGQTTISSLSSSSSKPISSSTTPTPLPSSSTSSSTIPPPNPTTPTPTPPVSPTPTAKPAPIGAIVGGVAGGLAVLGALLALALFCLRRRRDSPGHPPVKEIAESPAQPPHNPSLDKYPAVQVTSATPVQQSQYQQVPPQTQYPAEKYQAAAGGAFAANNFGNTSSPQGQQQYHAPQQTQQSPSVPMQPSYQPYQQPAPVGRFTEQQAPAPTPQNTYYTAPQGAPTFQVSSPSSPAPDARRESSISSVSAPGSPAPPYVGMTRIPDVPEMAGENQQRTEMDGQTRDHTYPISGRNEMSGESRYQPPLSY